MAVYGGPDIVTEGLVLNLDAANVKSFDPVNPNVELLLHMDGANNSTTFTDSSKNGTTVTRYGNAKVSTDQSKFGGSSAYFDGNGDYLRADGNTNFGTGDFTIDCWVMLTSDAKYFSIDTRNVLTSNAGIQLAFGATGIGVYIYGIGSLPLYSTSIQLNTWYHVAFCRRSGVLTGYLNGIAGTPVTVTNNFTNNYGTIATNINNRLNSSVQAQAWFNGFLDELRIVKGKALYTSNFTPERKPYLDGNKIYDLSGNENNGTLVNGPTYSSDNYGVMSFDGSNDYTVLNNVYEIGTSNFSISCWVKSSYTGNWQYILSNKENFNGPFVRCGFENGTGKLRLYLEADTQVNTVIVSNSSYTDGNWHNVVFIRNGSNGIIYVDGYLKKTATTQSGNVGNSTSSWFIANDGNNNGHLQGDVSNLCFYNRVLSAEEILQNFEATKGRYGL